MHPDYEAWQRFEKAIGDEAARLCRKGCDCPPTHICGAGRHPDWRRDAIVSLNDRLWPQEGQP